MKIKVGDNVKVIAGASKGKEGRVIKTLKKENRVVIEGVNIVKKHMKPNGGNEIGGIIDREAPVHVSNVKVVANKKTAKNSDTKKKETTKTKKTTKKDKE